MEHLKGNQMKREMKAKLAEARANMHFHDDETDSDIESPNLPHKSPDKRGKNIAQDSSDANKRPSEQVTIFNKFDDPYKFWKHQLSFEENRIIDLEKSLYTEEDASQIMKGFLNGLNNIHEMHYIHRDIKPENILLAPKGQPQDQELKIIDFGFSAKQKVGIKCTHEEKIGTVLFMAPE